VTLLSLEIIDTSEIDFLFPQVSLQMSSNTCEMLEDLEQVDKPKKKKKVMLWMTPLTFILIKD
jgi:hypothetical protein